MASANAAPPPAIQILIDGQSNNLSVYGGDYAWPPKLRATGKYGGRFTNVAVGGNSFTQLAQTAPTRLHPYCGKIAGGGDSVLLLVGGSTDIDPQDDTGAELYAEISDYADDARTAGVTAVIAATLTKSTSWTDPQRDRCDDFNVLLLADASVKFDAIVDLTTTSLETGGWGVANNPTDYLDAIHWSAVAHQKVADEFETALDAVLA